ncbi:MAG: hypothetical protein ABSF71_38245 [Terriglobia bacterium]|jgi:hypothetical protein
MPGATNRQKPMSLNRNALAVGGVGGKGKKGKQKITDSPTMLMKTKEERSDILTNATMLMKKNNLIPGTHDVDERISS